MVYEYIPDKIYNPEGYKSYYEYSGFYYFRKDYLGSIREVWLASTGATLQRTQYYPSGLPIENGIGQDVQQRKYNDKEWIEAHGYDVTDLGNRGVYHAINRFTSIDRFAEKTPWQSPYVHAGNNPVNYVDKDGDFPIYAQDGTLLGTDDNGLQGHAIIMDKNKFKQGMSYENAMKHNLGLDGLENQDAIDRYTTSFEGLSNRPDWDGYLTLKEANEWYRNGNGQPLFVALDKIDLSGIVSLGGKYVGQQKVVNLIWNSGSTNDGSVYGKITLVRYPNHQVRAKSDKYDFDMKPWSNPLNWGRNIETKIGEKVAGQGIKYEINIYGSKTLKPILPWIK